MKKYISIFVLVAFALLLVACNGNGNGNGNGNENKIALSYADWGDLEFNEKMIDAFEEKYPHITVELRTDIAGSGEEDRKSTRLNSSHVRISYAVFCLK